jgi:hypothetical protein
MCICSPVIFLWGRELSAWMSHICSLFATHSTRCDLELNPGRRCRKPTTESVRVAYHFDTVCTPLLYMVTLSMTDGYSVQCIIRISCVRCPELPANRLPPAPNVHWMRTGWSYATGRKAVGSIPNKIIGFFNWSNPSSRTPRGGGLEYFHRNPCES